MNDNQFTDIIKKLELLQSVKPDKDFKSRMERKILSYSAPKRFAMPLFSLRVAMIVFAFLMTGATVYGAAQKSQPGDTLYSLKEVINSVKTNLNAKTELSKAPTPELKKVTPTTNPERTPSTGSGPTANPTPTTAVQKQLLPRTEVIKQNPTATPTITPTNVPDKQVVLPAVKGTVDHAVDKLPVKLQIGDSSKPSPNPHSQNVGSKDNGSDAGAGGSLLPKIKIKL